MTLCRFLVILGLTVLPASAQLQPKQAPRIGYLTTRSVEFEERWLAVFRQGLKELGYVEGENIIIEERYAAGQVEKLPGLATDLVRLGVDVLVAASSTSAHAAKKATSTMPIVMVSADPVAHGLVASLARPGGNLTGLSDFHPGLVTKRLELLKEVVPSVTRVAVLWNPANLSNARELKDLQTAAPALGLTLLSLEVGRSEDIDRTFTTIEKERPGGLLLLGDPVISPPMRRIAAFAVKRRIPASYTVREWTEAGGLMSYGTSFAELYRRAATFVDKILKGARPTDLPIEQPTRFELVINLKTARALGLTIPRLVLTRADDVVQ
ncbi:MAG: ABC transporter substrate-binding protein [Candidatus Rokuibacteriota bacterium]